MKGKTMRKEEKIKKILETIRKLKEKNEYVTPKMVMEACGMCKQTVYKYLDVLEAKGLIKLVDLGRQYVIEVVE